MCVRLLGAVCRAAAQRQAMDSSRRGQVQSMQSVRDHQPVYSMTVHWCMQGSMLRGLGEVGQHLVIRAGHLDLLVHPQVWEQLPGWHSLQAGHLCTHSLV